MTQMVTNIERTLCCPFNPGFESHQYLYKYMNQKGSAAMLTVKRLAGVAPVVTLGDSLHTGEEAGKQGIHPCFESYANITKNPKTGLSVAPT